MPVQQFLVVSYDISSNRRRTKVMKTLEGYGTRVQYSVFECDLTRAQYLVLRHRLDNHLKKSDGDSMRFYFLCEECQKKVERIGGELPREDDTIIV